ncbi:hypothetical protein HDU67_005973 [Dinochytrium kinnereticum]|nr:hypothetical protein HDU67_005973 [Dinochytrium kinnereticum]
MGKKQLRQQALDACPTPLQDDRYVGKVKEIRGGGLYEVDVAYPVEEGGADAAAAAAAGGEYKVKMELVKLPTRFRNAVWIKRGSFAIIQLTPATKTKITGEILHILRPEHIKDLKSQNLWPSKVFDVEPVAVARREEGSEEEEDDDGIFVNRNRRGAESDDDDEEEEEEVEEEAVVTTGEESGDAVEVASAGMQERREGDERR